MAKVNYEILPQLAWNGFVSGALYALLALGLALSFGVLKYINFAHGETAMLGAYITFFFNSDCAIRFGGICLGFNWPFVASVAVGLAVMAIVALIIEYATYLPVKDASPLIALITSIGVALILKNGTLMAFGANVHSFSLPVKTYNLFGGRLIFTNVHIGLLIATAICFVALYIFLKKTKTGKAIRAVSDNKEVASILGLNVRLIITVVFLLSTALATVAGIMVGLDQNLNPNLGTFLNFKAFAAVVLGGMGSIPGALLGGFFIGFAENLLIGIPIAGFYLPSGYKDAIAFIALLLMLYFRPAGFLGAKQSEAIRK